MSETTKQDAEMLDEIAERLEADSHSWFQRDRLYEAAGQLADSDRCAQRSMRAQREADLLRRLAKSLRAASPSPVARVGEAPDQ